MRMDGEPIVFTVSIGQGHNQAAKALKEELLTQGFQRVHIIDTFRFIHPLLHTSITYLYKFVIRYHPSLWTSIFKQLDLTSSFYRYYEHALRFLSKNIEREIIEKRPPFIISTHPSATWLIATVKEKNNLSIPLHSVITDFRLHPTYVHRHVTSYFTIDDEAKQFARSLGLNPSYFHQTGIPFPTTPPTLEERMLFRKKLEIKEDEFIITISGGSLGLSNYHAILDELEQLDEPLTIFCMTGHNECMSRKLKRYRSKHQLNIISYTDQFVHYLAVSDVIITKAGGLTLSEALACEIPVILYEPLPGHEQLNAQLAVHWGIAIHAHHRQQLKTCVKQILQDDCLKRKMILCARRYKKVNAAKQIVNKIIYRPPSSALCVAPVGEGSKE